MIFLIFTVEASRESNPFLSMNSTGRELVCSSVQGMVSCRYKLCCSLAVFLDYLTRLTEEVCQHANLSAHFIPGLHILLLPYYIPDVLPIKFMTPLTYVHSSFVST